MSNPVLRALVLVLLLALAVDCAAAAAPPATSAAETLYYGIEIQGVTGGYSKVDVFPETVEGREVDRVEETLFMMLSALGSPFNTEATMTFLVDRASGDLLRHRADITQGENEIHREVSLLPSPERGKLVSRLGAGSAGPADRRASIREPDERECPRCACRPAHGPGSSPRSRAWCT